MTSLLHWAFYFVGPFIAAWAAVYVWAHFEILSYAMVAGTLAGAMVTLGISFLFWSDPDIDFCDYCYAEGQE